VDAGSPGEEVGPDGDEKLFELTAFVAEVARLGDIHPPPHLTRTLLSFFDGRPIPPM